MFHVVKGGHVLLFKVWLKLDSAAAIATTAGTKKTEQRHQFFRYLENVSQDLTQNCHLAYLV